MKYAVHYYKSFRYFNQIDEVVFDYKGTEVLTTFIPNLLKPNQRAIINLSNLDIEEVFEYLLILKQKHEYYAVQIDFHTQLDWIPALEENNIQYMFYNYAGTMDQFYSFTQYNISDIYICEGLGFNLTSIQSIREKGVAIRIFPDMVQYNPKYPIPVFTKFFVRPEGLDIYEKYIDVIELYQTSNRLSVLYEIYKQRQWTGYIEDVIAGFPKDFSLLNPTILPMFDSLRVGCNRSCLADGKCHYCYRMLSLSPLLEENDLYLVRKKDSILTKETKEEYRKNMEKFSKEENKDDRSGINEVDMLFE